MELEDQVEGVREVAVRAAHDLNNQFAIIQSYIEFVLDELPKGSPEHADLIHAQNASQRGVAIVSKLVTDVRLKDTR